jgi:hypothetical protein
VGGKIFLPEIIGNVLYKKAETAEEILLARRLHHDGYLRVGYISKPTPTGTIDDGYHKFSDHLIAICLNNTNHSAPKRGEIVGVIRAVKYSQLGFPVINEFKLYPEVKKLLEVVDMNYVIEVGALFAKPGYFVAKGLYRAIWQYSKIRGDRYWLAAIDKRLFNIFIKRYHFYFDQIGPEKFYLGSVSVPAILDCRRQKILMYQNAPELAAFYDKAKFPSYLEPIIELV